MDIWIYDGCCTNNNNRKQQSGLFVVCCRLLVASKHAVLENAPAGASILRQYGDRLDTPKWTRSQKMRSITMRCSTAASRPMAAMVSWRVRSVMIMMMMMMMMILSCSRQMNNHNNHHTMVDGFSILLLAAARRGNLKRALDIDNDDWKNAATTKMGRGQLVTGVTLPTEVRIYSCMMYICTCI